MGGWWVLGGWSVKTDFKAHSGSQLQLSIQVRAEFGNKAIIVTTLIPNPNLTMNKVWNLFLETYYVLFGNIEQKCGLMDPPRNLLDCYFHTQNQPQQKLLLT